MEQFDLVTFSLIIKFWIEDPLSEGEPRVWRGRITHVPSGQETYFHNLSQLIKSLDSYLSDFGLDLQQNRSV